MTIIRRWKLPKNWPVIAAGIWLLISVFYFLYSFTDAVENPRSTDATFYYPLFRFYSETFVWVVFISLGGYLTLLVWAWVIDTRDKDILLGHILIVLGAPLLLCLAIPSIAAVVFWAGLILITLMPIIRIPQRGLPLIVFLLATMASFHSCDGSDNISHLDSAQFDGLTYHLTLFTPIYSEICLPVGYFVYQCDAQGVRCRSYRHLDELWDCLPYEEEPLEARMVVDPSDNRLYVLQGDKKVRVVP